MISIVRYFFGDWWQPVTEDGIHYGIYHHTIWHRWDYPYTRAEAQEECRKRNNEGPYLYE